jgi:hypothetical protein
MKRTTPFTERSVQPNELPNSVTDAQSDTGDDSAKSTAQIKPKPAKRQKLTPAEMEALVFSSLASDSEQRDSSINVKVGDPDRMTAPLPPELTTHIAWHVRSSRDQANMALTSRQNYRSIDIAHPLRRFSGIARDLHRTSMKREYATAQQMKCFLHQVARDGIYDRTLLTPLSMEVRVAALMTALSWLEEYMMRKDKEKVMGTALADFKAATIELQQACVKINPSNGENNFQTALGGIIHLVQNLALTQTKAFKKKCLQPDRRWIV